MNLKLSLKRPELQMISLFALVFFLLGISTNFFPVIQGVVSIPLWISLPIFIILLFGLIMIARKAVHDVSPAPWLEVLIMLAAILSPLSDGFWISLVCASVATIVYALKKGKLYWKSSILGLFLLLILIALVVSFFAIESVFLSFGAVIGLVLYALYFFAVYNSTGLLKGRLSVLLPRVGVLMSLSIVVTVIFSLWHYKAFPFRIDVLIFQFPYHTGFGNSFGMASLYGQWPTHSSAFLSLACWALLIIFPYIKSKIERITLIVGMIMALVGVFATLSRNAVLFVLVSAVFLMFYVLSNRQYRRFLPFLGGGILLSGGVIYQFLQRFDKWRSILHRPWETGTFQNRIFQYQFALEQWHEGAVSFLKGIGLMNFGPYFRRIKNDDTLPDYLHQLFLSIGFEMGIIALIVFILLMVQIGIILWQRERQHSKDLIFIMFSSWLVTGLFDNWLYFLWSSSLFMVLLAVGTSPLEEKND
ncbi:MAG: O-antigen ligase family protein [Brevinema sp.]